MADSQTRSPRLIGKCSKLATFGDVFLFFLFLLGKAQYLQSLAGATADKDICIRSENHLISKLNLNEKQIREEMSRNINQLKNIDQLKISRTKMKNKNKFRALFFLAY